MGLSEIQCVSCLLHAKCWRGVPERDDQLRTGSIPFLLEIVSTQIDHVPTVVNEGKSREFIDSSLRYLDSSLEHFSLLYQEGIQEGAQVRLPADAHVLKRKHHLWPVRSRIARLDDHLISMAPQQFLHF